MTLSTATEATAASGLPRIASYRLPVELPANRVDWSIEPQRAVLLVHDMQRHFLAPFAVADEPLPRVLNAIARLRAAADAAGVPVVFTCQPPAQPPRQRRLLTDFWGPGIQHAADAEVVAELAPTGHDTVLTKWRYSAFQRTPLRELLRDWGRDQLVISGVYAHIGCLATAIEAFAHDVQAFMVADAVADFGSDEHLAALRYVANRCGRVSTADEVTSALAAGTASAPATGGVAESHSSAPSVDDVRSEIAALLGEPDDEVGLDENLLGLGLDSVRVMTIVERWRGRGWDISLADLAGDPTVRGWHERLERAAQDR